MDEELNDGMLYDFVGSFRVLHRFGLVWYDLAGFGFDIYPSFLSTR